MLEAREYLCDAQIYDDEILKSEFHFLMKYEDIRHMAQDESNHVHHHFVESFSKFQFINLSVKTGISETKEKVQYDCKKHRL